MPDESLPHRILACVESIPPGKVMTYGDVAEYCGSRAPRMVGRVLSQDGRGELATRECERELATRECERELATRECERGELATRECERGELATREGEPSTVPWHRVLRADGTCAEHLYAEQRQRLLSEGVRFDGDRVDLEAHRWDGRPVSPRSAAPAS